VGTLSGTDDAGMNSHDAATGAGDAATAAGVDSVVLEVDGMTFPLCTATTHGLISDYECGNSTKGGGPWFDSLQCAQSIGPRYELGILFHDVDPAGIVAGTTFDLSDSGREQYITVVLDVGDSQYCTAAPPDDAGAQPAVSGTVIVHQYGPVAGQYTADVEIVDAIVPALDGGPPYKIVSAHLYY
jgi:hypothetical protein